MKSPLVSIVICCYNRSAFLPQTLTTVFAQAYQPVEIVVVDDGSTDATPELIAGYGDRLRYFRQENRGIAVARSVGCQLARGEYIAFQDDDDLMVPGRIPCLLNAMRQYPGAVLALGDYAFIDAEGKPNGRTSKFAINAECKAATGQPVLLQDGYAAILWPRVTPLPHTTLFRRSDAERIQWFDPTFFHACSDTDFFARLGRLGPIVYVPEVVSCYRNGHASIWSKKLAAEYSRLLLFEKHIQLAAGHRDLKRHLQRRLFATLTRMHRLTGGVRAVYDGIPEDYRKRGLALLPLKDRLALAWYVNVRFPVRTLLQGRAATAG